MSDEHATIRQTFVLPAALIEKVDKIAAQSKRSRNGTVEILLEQALRIRDERFQKYLKVKDKILAAATDEEADQYGGELIDAIFGTQKRKAKRA